MFVAQMFFHKWGGFNNFLEGKDACFDVTVTNVATFKQAFEAYGRGENLGKIARNGYDTKIRKSKGPCEQAGYLFYPIAFESTGGIVSESINTLKTFCNRVCSGRTAKTTVNVEGFIEMSHPKCSSNDVRFLPSLV